MIKFNVKAMYIFTAETISSVLMITAKTFDLFVMYNIC